MIAQLAENIWFVAALWMALAFVASLVSIRLGIAEWGCQFVVFIPCIQVF